MLPLVLQILAFLLLNYSENNEIFVGGVLAAPCTQLAGTLTLTITPHSDTTLGFVCHTFWHTADERKSIRSHSVMYARCSMYS